MIEIDGNNRLKMLLLVMIVMFSMFTAPGFAQQKMEITMLGTMLHLEALEPLIDEFNESQDRIEVVIMPRNISVETVLASYLAGDMPDIIESGRLYTHAFGPRGMLADLTPFIDREGGAEFLSDWIPAAFESDNTLDGRVYGLPIHLALTGYYYNPDIFQDAGLGAIPSGWTWRDLEEYATKARRYRPDGSRDIWGIVAEDQLGVDFPMMGQRGAAFVTKDFQVDVISEGVRETYEWIIDMIDRDLMSYGPGVSPHGTAARNARPFNAAFVGSQSGRQDFWNAYESPMTVTPPLRYDTSSTPATFFADRSLAIMNVSPERQEAAWEVVTYLTSPEVSARWNAALGYIAATFSSYQHPIYQDFVASQPNIALWAEYFTIRFTPPFPSHLYTTDLYSSFVQARRPMLSREESVEAFITNFEPQVTRYVEEYLSNRP